MKDIHVTPNYREKTFTIKVIYSNDSRETYRTYPLSILVFAEMEYNTINDWKYFLNHSNDYYVVTGLYKNPFY